jgi:hypothetical protein
MTFPAVCEVMDGILGYVMLLQFLDHRIAWNAYHYCITLQHLKKANIGL